MAHSTDKIDLPPGVYSRAQVPDYDAIDAVNYSSLKMLVRSPKHYRHHMDNGSRETRDMFKGTTSHVAILEPERFATDYAVFQGKTKRGKAWDAFKAAHSDVAIIKAVELAEAIAMRDAVRSDALASAYLSNGRHEVTLVWIDQETGLKMKGRVDWLRNDNVLVDVKTARDATPFFFSGAVAKLLYHVQCAMYLDAVETITGKEARFIVLAIEKAAPYDVVPYAVPEPTLGVGRDEYRRLLRLLIECRQTNRWPGISNGFELQLNLPAYAMPDESDLDALGLEQ